MTPEEYREHRAAGAVFSALVVAGCIVIAALTIIICALGRWLGALNP